MSAPVNPATRILLAVAVGLMAGTALARLPPPTAEDQAKAEKKKEDTKAEAERQKKETADVQDRIVRRYRSEHPDAAHPKPAASAELKETDVPSGGKSPDVPHPGTGN